LWLRDSYVQSIIDANSAGFATQSAMTSGLAAKEPLLATGTPAQYLAGDKSWHTFPTQVSAFSNDAGFITSSSLMPYVTSSAMTVWTGSTAVTTLGTIVTGTWNGSQIGDTYIASASVWNAKLGPTSNGSGLTGITKTQIGLPNVDNTSDANKPVSTATQTALNGKAASVHTHIATDITDTTAVGRAVMTAATQADGRNALGITRTVNNAPARTLVSVAAAANGFQIDAARDTSATYSVTINTSSTLASGSAGYVVLEIAATNSVTASDWKEISRTADGQNNGLIVGLALNQVGGGNVTGIIPAGWYARIRTVNTTGTPTYTYNSGQETKL